MASDRRAVGLPFTFVSSQLSATIEAGAEIAGSIVVRLDGYLDEASAGRLQHSMRPVLDQKPPSVLFDMTGLGYFGEPGLGVLTVFLKAVRTYGGVMCLCCVDPNVRWAFQLLGIEQFFNILDTREQAVRFLRDCLDGSEPAR